MPTKDYLYLIALIPHFELREKIKALKEEMKQRFNTKHALKSPAHITLQMPFKRVVKEENYILKILKAFANTQKVFHIDIDGFGCFTPRVLFAKVTNHTPIIQLHANLKEVLKDQLDFQEKKLTSNIYPHMTIATRDLSEPAFYKAWPEFEDRVFKASFEVNSLFLLKHNGKYWDVFKEFLFGLG